MILTNIQADHFITTAYRSIARAERIIHRALKSRERALENLRTRSGPESSPYRSGPFTYLSAPQVELPDQDNLSPPSSALSSTYSSAQSSRVSLSSTLTDTDDEDTRALRGLLLRRIEARLDGSFEELDKATSWLRIVKEVVRGVKIQAGL